MATLSKRETQCPIYASCGHTNPRIADQLGLSHETVKSHLTSAYRKLGAVDQASAVVTALKAGLID